MTTETTTQKAPSAFARAEAGSRQVVLQVGLGVMGFILGSILSVGAAARIGERLGPLESEWGALVFRWIFERLWLFAVVPVFGYAIGRFTAIKPVRFAMTALISGEIFSVLLVTAINGFDFLLQDTGSLIGRGITLFLGMLVTAWAVQSGRADAAVAQVEANVVAEKRKAEYAQFLAAAEGKGEEKPVSPVTDAAPAAGGVVAPSPAGGVDPSTAATAGGVEGEPALSPAGEREKGADPSAAATVRAAGAETPQALSPTLSPSGERETDPSEK